MESEYGKKLKDARNKQGLKLEDISYDLKINLKTLKKIEDSKTEELPKAPFTKGFIKTYCTHLGLKPNLIIEEYEKTLNEPIDKLEKGILREDVKIKSFFAFDFFKNKFLPIAILLATILGTAVLYFQLGDQYLNAARVKSVNSQAVLELKQKQSEETLETKEVKSILKASKLLRAVTVYDDNEDEGVKKSRPVVFKNTLMVEPLVETRLYIQTNLDSKPVKAYLKPDKRRIFKFEEAKIRFLDAGAVNLIINGKDIGTLGVFGEEKTIQFPSMKEL